MDLQELLKFTQFFHAFQQVKRAVIVNNEDRFENDAEHSFQVAITAWYVVESRKLNFDINLIIKYALIHDFVEVYAGDTYIYDGDQNQHNSKKEREEAALITLKNEFPECNEFWDLIKKYESREDEESNFVYVIDKLLPVMNIYLDNGRSWNKKSVTLDMIRENKTPKMAKSKELYPYWEELLKLLEENEDKLFNKENKKL